MRLKPTKDVTAIVKKMEQDCTDEEIAHSMQRLKKRSRYWFAFIAAIVAGIITYKVAKQHAPANIVETIAHFAKKQRPPPSTTTRNIFIHANQHAETYMNLLRRNVISEKEAVKGVLKSVEGLPEASKIAIIHKFAYYADKPKGEYTHPSLPWDVYIPEAAASIYAAMEVPTLTKKM